MNASPLVLSPSGHPDIIPPTSASATAAKSGNAAAGHSTFAGALKNASPKPARKSTSSKAADDDRTGSGLPVSGNHPPQTTPTPHAHPQAAAPQPAAPAAAASAIGAAASAIGAATGAAGAAAGTSGTAAGATGGGDDGPDAESGAVTGLAANANHGAGAAGAPKSAVGADDGGDPAGDATDVVPGPAAGSAASVASGQSGTGKLNTAFNNLLGLPEAGGAANSAGVPSSAASAAAVATAESAGPISPAGAAASGAAAPGAAGQAAVSGAAAAAGRALNITAKPTVSSAVAKSPAKLPAAGLRSPAGAGASAGGDDASGDTAVTGSGVPAGAALAAAVSAPAPNDSSAIAAAAASQAADPAAAVGGNAGDPAASGSGVAGSGAAAPATAVALAVARAAASVATAQSAAALAAGNDADKHTPATSDAPTPGSTGTDAVAGMFQLNPTASATTDATATPTFQLHQSLDGGDLAQGLSDHVTYMVDNGLNGAKLQVNPPQLGPIELRIAVSGGHAQVWMTTHSAVTRDALESSSSKLREMLGAQGFGQVSVDVSQRSFQDRSNQAQPYQRMAAERGTTATAAAAAVANAAPRTSRGALDAYA